MDLPPVSGGDYGAPARPVVVVGYDGSPGGRAALAYAAWRAGHEGLVVIVNAAAPAPDWFGAPSYQPAAPGEGKPLVEGIELPEGVRHETVVEHGSPPRLLERAAARYEADEIVVGRHGSDPARTGLGDVPLALLGHARCPVVVVPTGWKPA